MTWSPGESSETCNPTASTIPAASWPRMAGVGKGYRPSTKCRSLWQTPEATTRTSTSRPAGLSMSTFSIVSGWWGPWNMAAFISSSWSGRVRASDRVQALLDAPLDSAAARTRTDSPARPGMSRPVDRIRGEARGVQLVPKPRSGPPSCGRCAHLGDGLVQHGHDPVDLRARQDQRRRQDDGIAQMAAASRAPDEDAALLAALDDLLDLRGGHDGLRRTVGDELDARVEALAADVADPPVARLQRPQRVEEIGAVLGRALV